MNGKYKYNRDTLSFEKVETNFAERIAKVLLFVVIAVISGFAFVFFTFSYFDSPKERRLKRELEQYTLQYDILNKRVDHMGNVMQGIQERDDNIYRVIFEADRIPENIRRAGIGGINRYKELEGYDNTSLVISSSKLVDQLEKEMYIQTKSFDEVVKLARQKEQMLSAIPAIQPVSNVDLTRMASGYGMRIHPIYKTEKMHTGMDFTATTGTDVYATGNGVVDKVERSNRGFGNHVVIDHGFGYKTTYAHLKSFNVRRGQKVNRGEVIGFVGNTGTSTAPHLHYEVHKNDQPINPVNFYFNDLSPEEYDAMLLISSNRNQSFD